MTIRNIAKALHRSPSTRFREINRNKIGTNSKGRVYKYYPIKAQELYESRKNAIVRRSMIRISLTILKKKQDYTGPLNRLQTERRNFDMFDFYNLSNDSQKANENYYGTFKMKRLF